MSQKLLIYHIQNAITRKKNTWLHKKDVENIFLALLAKEIIRYLAMFYFHAKPQPCIFLKALGRLCKTKLHVFHTLMVCHPPSDVHMGCSYTCRVVQFEQCKPVLTTFVDFLQPEWLKLHQFWSINLHKIEPSETELFVTS